MNRKLFLAFLLLLFSFVGKAQSDEKTPQWESNKLFLKVRIDSNLELPEIRSARERDKLAFLPGLFSLSQSYDLQGIRKPFRTPDVHLQHTYELRFDKKGGLWDFVEGLNALPWVEYAEAIPVYTLQLTPNDLSSLQWSLDKVEAEKAWDITQGSADVVVAIVDDAVRLSHEDLRDRIWTNPGEIPGDSIDNDGNGFIDDVNGWDAADEDNDPNPPAGATNGLFTHGTHVAGIAGATTNNGKGGASIGYNIRLMPVKTKHDSTIGAISLDNTYDGVDYAIATGADVVNMSFGGQGYSQTYQGLFNAGHNAGVTFVAACGNNGAYIAFYPANYDNVISVGSTDPNDEKSGFSNYHFYVDVMAPGAGIWNTLAGSDDAYGFQSGTSMSSPLVAGLAGLLLSIDSTLTPDEVEACLEGGCENIDALNPDYVGRIGAGRINALYSAQCVAYGAGGPQPMDLGMQLKDPYPNPAADRVHLAAHFPEGEKLQLILRDVQGREIQTLFLGQVPPGDIQWDWDCRSLTAGTWLIEWRLGERSFFQKLLKP